MRKWLALFILVIFVAEPQAQQRPAYGNGGAPSATSAASATTIDLLVGRSTLLNVGAPIARVSLTVPDIADALVTSAQQLLIHGKAPGTISLFVWDKSGGIKTYEVVVRRDLSSLSDQLHQLFPGEDITVYGSGKDVVLSGMVSSKYVVEKAAEVAGGYVEKKDNVVNLLKQQEGVASNQVLLRVRFAEVSRSAMRELGASYVADAYKTDWFGRVTTQQFAAPEWDEQGRLVFSDFLNFFVFNAKEGLGAVVRALSNKGLFQSLAEPNLVATNGKEASFLAGGEFPYPVVQGSGVGQSVTILFKEFGVRLSFTPTILNDDIINVKVKPEVSALDFSSAVTVAGFRVPALSTRRTETEVELRDGQTFAVAGLLNNTVTSTMSKVPGIGDIPILGLLFRSKAHQKNETELVVIITPHILRRGAPGAATGLPNMIEPFLGRPSKQVPPPPAHLGSPRYPMQGQQAPVGPASPSESTHPTIDPYATNPYATGTNPPSGQVARPVANPTQRTQTQPQPDTRTQPVPQQPQATPAAGSVTVTQVPTPAPRQTTAAPTQNPAASASPAPAKLTKAQEEAIERARHEEKRQRDVEAKQAIENARQTAEDKKRADADKKKADEIAAKQAIVDAKKAREQAKLDAEAAKRAEIARKKQAEEDAKRNKAIADAAARLREAQAAYQAAVKTNADKKPPQQ